MLILYIYRSFFKVLAFTMLQWFVWRFQKLQRCLSFEVAFLWLDKNVRDHFYKLNTKNQRHKRKKINKDKVLVPLYYVCELYKHIGNFSTSTDIIINLTLRLYLFPQMLFFFLKPQLIALLSQAQKESQSYCCVFA